MAGDLVATSYQIHEMENELNETKQKLKETQAKLKESRQAVKKNDAVALPLEKSEQERQGLKSDMEQLRREVASKEEESKTLSQGIIAAEKASES